MAVGECLERSMMSDGSGRAEVDWGPKRTGDRRDQNGDRSGRSGLATEVAEVGWSEVDW